MDLGAVRQSAVAMGALVRPLSPEDRPAVEDALIRCAAFNEQEVHVALELFDAGIEGGYSLLGAEVEGLVRGYVCLGPASLTESTWYLYWICVHPDWQRRGIGRMLQSYSEAFVKSQGGRRVVLETSGRIDYGRPRSFYEAAGYRRAGLIEDFYRDGDDCVIYSKVLE